MNLISKTNLLKITVEPASKRPLVASLRQLVTTGRITVNNVDLTIADPSRTNILLQEGLADPKLSAMVVVAPESATANYIVGEKVDSFKLDGKISIDLTARTISDLSLMRSAYNSVTITGETLSFNLTVLFDIIEQNAREIASFLNREPTERELMSLLFDIILRELIKARLLSMNLSDLFSLAMRTPLQFSELPHFYAVEFMTWLPSNERSLFGCAVGFSTVVDLLTNSAYQRPLRGFGRRYLDSVFLAHPDLNLDNLISYDEIHKIQTWLHGVSAYFS